MPSEERSPLSKTAMRRLIENRMKEDPSYARSLRADGHWTSDRIEAMSTDDIIARLRGAGIPLDPDAFEQDLRRLKSAERVADEWMRRHQPAFRGLDEDMPFFAAAELRKRLHPQIVTSEVLDDWMQEGYELLSKEREIEACDLWLRVWDAIREGLPGTDHQLEDAEALVRGTQSVFNWCQDFEGELHNAGLKDRKYLDTLNRVCREFRRLFPGDELVPHFRRAEAESLFLLGRRDEGDACYAALVAEHPDWAWGYIGWADEYWLWKQRAPKDHAKAEEIYRRALDRPELEERAEVYDRLASLYEEWGRPDEAKRHARLARAERKHGPEPGVVLPKSAAAVPLKAGRNDPCPCGSGRKFKKCCQE